MKKQIIPIIFGLILLFYTCLPTYTIFSSISSTSQTYRETTLIVFTHKFWALDNIAKEIVSTHNQINGTPSKLNIDFFLSKIFFKYNLPLFSFSQTY